MKRLTYNIVKKRITEVGLELISEEYINATSKLRLRCKCGNVFERSFNSIFNKYKIRNICLNCTYKHMSMIKIKSVDEVCIELKSHGFELLSGYDGAFSNIQVKCVCGRIYKTKLIKLREHNFICRGCAHRKYNFNMVKNMFLNLGATPLFNKYSNCNDKLKFRCSTSGCNNIWYIRYINLLRGYNSQLKCKECQKIYYYKRGEESPTFNPDLTQEERILRRKELWYLDWKKEVMRLYNYTCCVTGDKINLEIHHLYNWRDYPERRVLINNGVVLNKEIHRDFHKEYGYKNNTHYQFKEFIERY